MAHMLHLWADSLANLWPTASFHADHSGKCSNSAAHAADSVHQDRAKESSGIERPYPTIARPISAIFPDVNEQQTRTEESS